MPRGAKSTAGGTEPRCQHRRFVNWHNYRTPRALRRNILRRTVLAVDETHSEDQGEAPRCEETGRKSGDIHTARAGEHQAAPQAERTRGTQARSNSGHAGFGDRAQAPEHAVSFLAGTVVHNDETVVGTGEARKGT